MRVRSIPSKFAFLMLIAMLAIPVFAQQPRKESLLNGLKVLMFPDSSSDKVWVRIRVNSGSAFDPQGKEGLMQILSANFFPTDAAKEYFRDELGGSLAITANYDYIEVDASSKPEDLNQMLETLSSGISNTVIDKDTTAKLRTDLTAKVKQLEADPNYVADRAAAKRLFGTFPYGRPIYGTEDSIKKIDIGDMLDAKQRFLTADNSTMAISGNFQPARVLPAVKRYFGGWTKADRHIPATFRQPDEPDMGLVRIDIPGMTKTYSVWALTAPKRVDSDYIFARLYESVYDSWRCGAASSYEAYLLNGFWNDQITSNIDGAMLYSGPCPDVRLHTKPDTTAAEAIDETSLLEAKKAILFQERQKGALERRWLDADTYGLKSPEDELDQVENATLKNIQDFVRRLYQKPQVSVLVSIPGK
jgi:predicted Zn-dependent peptidase